MEVSHLESSVYEVDLRGNPCTKWPNYKDVLLSSMPTAMYIDGSEVSTAERVYIIDLFIYIVNQKITDDIHIRLKIRNSDIFFESSSFHKK